MEVLALAAMEEAFATVFADTLEKQQNPSADDRVAYEQMCAGLSIEVKAPVVQIAVPVEETKQ